MPGSSVVGSPEFKRVAKWQISPVSVARRIYDVKAERRLSRRVGAIPSRIPLRSETNKEEPGSESTRLIEPAGDTAFAFCALSGGESARCVCAERGLLSFRAHRALPSGWHRVKPSLGAHDSADDVPVSIIYHRYLSLMIVCASKQRRARSIRARPYEH